MDAPDPAIPPGLRETTRASLDESSALAARWHGAAGGRLRYAYAPRFALSCTDELLREVAAEAPARGVRVHTHSSENRAELALVRDRAGVDNVDLPRPARPDRRPRRPRPLHPPRPAASAASWPGPGPTSCTARSSNLKLASGVALVPELLDAGVKVSIGADGAPCNNNLDAFLELRLAALLHKPRVGPRAIPARDRAPPRHQRRRRRPRPRRARSARSRSASAATSSRSTSRARTSTPTENPMSAIVYAARSSDVRHVAVDGRVVVRDRALLTLDLPRVVAQANQTARRLFKAL